jgi:hypothetical protein
LTLEQDFFPVNKRQHDLKAFDCGKPSMNEFLNRHSIKHSKLGLSRTYVLEEKSQSDKKTIAAYYTLAASSVSRSEIPATTSLPAYPLPVIMLARLAIDKKHQGIGLGAKALVYSLRHAVKLSGSGLPAYGLILDILDEEAKEFYKRFDMFLPFTDDPMRLFVPMKTIEML